MFASDSIGTTGTPSSDSGGVTGDPGGTSSTSAGPVADASSGDDTASPGTGSTSTTGETSGATGTACGDGVADEGEACDDGNDDDFDDCTSQCTIPACDDRQHNGDETDVDCGGSCPECVLCQACGDEADCESGLVCGTEGQCVTHFEMSVDWVDNCGSQSQGVTIQGLAAGNYRATASESAGTRWLPPHEPPSTGYYYDTACTGVNFEQMRTPEGLRYIDISTSFSNMISETETFQYAGGDFTCWAEDNGCDDNNGSVAFSLELICDR